MKTKFLFILVICLLAALPAMSQTVTYFHGETPVFSVKMPNGWEFETKPNPRDAMTKRISGMAPNGYVWFGVWIVKNGKTVDQAYKYVQGVAKTLILDAKETKTPVTGEVNGMKAKFSEHQGTMKMKDGKSQLFNAKVTLFETGGRVGIAAVVADADGMKAESANIETFFKSIRAVK